jgi:hypothetical protein
MTDRVHMTQPVLVTTAHRGVFFGYIAPWDGATDLGPTVTLHKARCCIYWPTSNRGFIGLATDGPAAGSRVGPAVPLMQLREVTSVSVCTAGAADRWESAPWK